MRTLVAVLVVLMAGAGPGAALADATDGPPDSHAPLDADDEPQPGEQWQRTYGSSGDDIFADVARADDGGYLLVGWTETDDRGRDGWVLKVDGEGRRQWSKRLGGDGTDRFWGVAATDDGYLLVGRTDDGGPRGWAVELGPDGDVRDQRTLGTGAFYAVARRDAGDADYLLAGWTRGDAGTTGWAVALAGDGSRAWEHGYAVPDGYDAGYVRAVVSTDAGYYLAGKVEGDSDDAWALRVGADGNREWAATAGGPERDDVWAAAPAARDGDATAGFVLAGETESDSTGPRDGWLVKFGPDGEVAWERRPGGEGTQWLDSAMRTDDGFLFTGGSSAGPKGSADGYVVATDADGRSRWQTYYGTDGWDKPWPAVRAHGPGYLLAGQTSGRGAAGKDGWLVRIGADAADGNGTTTGSDATATVTATETTTSGSGSASDSGSDSTTDSGSTATTAEAMRDETTGRTAADGSGSVPGFGVGAAIAALSALAALLAAVRR